MDEPVPGSKYPVIQLQDVPFSILNLVLASQLWQLVDEVIQVKQVVWQAKQSWVLPLS